MSIAEIPSKIVESAESLTEKKLEVSMELTKIIYSQMQTHIQEEDILATYFRVFKSLKEVLPPPLEKRTLRKIPSLRTVLIITLLSIIGGLYLMYRMRTYRNFF